MKSESIGIVSIKGEEVKNRKEIMAGWSESQWEMFKEEVNQSLSKIATAAFNHLSDDEQIKIMEESKKEMERIDERWFGYGQPR